MHPNFATIVDPVFESTIQYVARLERGDTLDPWTVQTHLRDQLQQGDIAMGSLRSWELAKYALASWIDEMMLSLPWSGKDWWQEHILEMQIFQSRLCSLRFFEWAKEATALPQRDALEVYYNCVLLGFRGMYSDPLRTPQDFVREGWPASLEQWLEITLKRIEYEGQDAHPDIPQRSISGAMPLESSRALVGWSLAALLLFMLDVAIVRMQLLRQ